jgi:hypothetical protein
VYVIDEEMVRTSSRLEKMTVDQQHYLTRQRNFRPEPVPTTKMISSVSPVPLPQSAAPFFKADALVEGQFTEVSLSDYKGKCM